MRPTLPDPVPASALQTTLAAPPKARLPGELLGAPPACAQASLTRGAGRMIGAKASANSPVTGPAGGMMEMRLPGSGTSFSAKGLRLASLGSEGPSPAQPESSTSEQSPAPITPLSRVPLM